MLEITAVDDEPAELAGTLERLLGAHGDAAGYTFAPVTLAFEARLDGERIGGVHAVALNGWVLVKYLAVAPGHRGAGTGRALMERLEAAAVAGGAEGLFVDTYGFQAPGLYRRLGYEEIGRLPTPDPGRTRHFFRKRLRRAPG